VSFKALSFARLCLGWPLLVTMVPSRAMSVRHSPFMHMLIVVIEEDVGI